MQAGTAFILWSSIQPVYHLRSLIRRRLTVKNWTTNSLRAQNWFVIQTKIALNGGATPLQPDQSGHRIDRDLAMDETSEHVFHDFSLFKGDRLDFLVSYKTSWPASRA